MTQAPVLRKMTMQQRIELFRAFSGRSYAGSSDYRWTGVEIFILNDSWELNMVFVRGSLSGRAYRKIIDLGWQPNGTCAGRILYVPVELVHQLNELPVATEQDGCTAAAILGYLSSDSSPVI